MLSLPYRLQILTLTLLAWLGIYFFVNRRQMAAQRWIVLETALDRKIPFVPQLAIIYFSTYVFVLQPFFILAEARQFYWMLASFATITVSANLIHASLPSKVERIEEQDTGGISGWMIHLFQQICKPYGNFPSMHVALSVPAVVANFMVSGLLMGSLTLVWAILIALSTLFTKQHYILDVLAGVLGGLLIFALMYWLILA